jgi:glycosyltransferase involved in cell wall biosynthesis
VRILFITMQLGRGYAQGTERYVTTLGECLSHTGHDVAYLAGDPLGHRSTAKLGVRVHTDDAGEISGELFHYPTSGWMAVAGRGRRRLRDWIASWEPDIVHVANPAHVGTSAIGIAREMAIPVVVTAMDFWWVCPKATLLRYDGVVCTGRPGWCDCLKCLSLSHPRPATQLLGRLPRSLTPLSLPLYLGRGLMRGMTAADMSRWPYRREFLAETLQSVDHVICPSLAMSEVVEPLLQPGRYTRIPYGLGPAWFENQRPMPRRTFEPGEMTIGFAGALQPHKGPHLLLQAIAQLGWKEAKIRLAGPGSDSNYREQLARLSDGLNVEFIGTISSGKMPAFLRSLDVLVLPSVWPENLPFILLEAHAAYVPVIASRLSGVVEQIGEERMLFAPGSAVDLAASLDWFRQNPQQSGIRPVLAAQEMTRRTLEIYESCVASVLRTGPLGKNAR